VGLAINSDPSGRIPFIETMQFKDGSNSHDLIRGNSVTALFSAALALKVMVENASVKTRALAVLRADLTSLCYDKDSIARRVAMRSSIGGWVENILETALPSSGDSIQICATAFDF
jgi:hypothetical protein